MSERRDIKVLPPPEAPNITRVYLNVGQTYSLDGEGILRNEWDTQLVKFVSPARPDSIGPDDLIGCARCHGEGHKALTWERLVHPVSDPDGDFTHWTPCPTNGQPILLRLDEHN